MLGDPYLFIEHVKFIEARSIVSTLAVCMIA